MRRILRTSAAALTVLASIAFVPEAHAVDSPYDVLVFSKTAGFRHDSIAAGVQAIRELGATGNFTVTATEDGTAFTPATLAQYEAVVFLSTTTNPTDPDSHILDAAQRSAFEGYIRAGGGFVGVHAAADTEYFWPFYGGLVGAYFKSHPVTQQATVKVENRATAATAALPQTLTRTDEWYDYAVSPRSTARVLASLDESSYSGGTMGADHPHIWCKAYEGGRSFYLGGGHTQQSYSESALRTMLLGCIRYAAGRSKADCRPETGYTPLFDGSMSGWSQAGPGAFTNSDATLKSTGGMGLLWYSAKQYTSYSLKLDWKMDGDDNSGVFVGFPASSDPMSAVSNGYEVQIDATDSADRTTGSVYGSRSADLTARDAALNPPGEWNAYEILVEGERLQVFLNGVKINDFTNTDPARSLAGYVGLQNHGTGDDVSFRHVRIKDLSAASGTVQAESFSSAQGVEPYTKAGANGGRTLGYIDPGDWAAYDNVNVGGSTTFKARVVSGGPGGTIQIRSGSQTGPILGSVAVPNTGGWSTFADISTPLSNVPASANIFLTFTGSGSGLFDLDDFAFVQTPPPSGPVVGLAGQCLDVRAASNADGTQVQIYTCNQSPAQTWTRVGQTFRALGKCLDVNAASKENNAKIQLYTCNATVAQNWVPQSDGTLVNPNSGKCLDVTGSNPVNSTPVILWTCSPDAPNQKWTIA